MLDSSMCSQRKKTKITNLSEPGGLGWGGVGEGEEGRGCGVVWCGVVWCWCGVVWCGVVWKEGGEGRFGRLP